MRNVLGSETVLDNAFLDAMRETTDPSADAVAATVIAGNAYKRVAELMRNRQMWDADGEPSRALPEDIRVYMRDASRLPHWHDRKAIDEAQAFFLLYGLA